MKSLSQTIIFILCAHFLFATNSEDNSILFAEAYFPIENKEEATLLSNYTFGKENDLFIRVVLAKPLVEYLKELSAESDDQILIENGNYQFSFMVDQELIYREQLHPGAGTNESKSKWTTFMVPLQSKEEIDSWGRFLWKRFMKEGGKSALQDGNHQLSIEIRPYFQGTALEVGEVIASGTIDVEKVTKQIPKRRLAVQKIKSKKAFPTNPDVINPELITKLNQEIQLENFSKISSIIVLKEGQLVLEEYFNGAKKKTLHDTRSVGKTIAGTILGIAIQEGYIESVDQKISSFYDLVNYKNYSSSKSEITIKDLLTMSTGLDAFDFQEESPGHEEKMYPTDDWVKFTLDLPMSDEFARGKDWRYTSAGAVLLGDILDKSVPGGLEEYAREKLFEPLNISKYKWQYTPTGVANTAGSLKLSSIDLAKIGQLYRTGIHEGYRILSNDWVDQSTSKQIQIPFLDEAYYGYLLWNKMYQIKEQNHECYYASGNGGNKIYIFKDIDLVVVITAQAYNSIDMHDTPDEIMEEYILKAITNQ